MAFIPRRRRIDRSLMGLGGVESCGANQVWDPNIEYLGQKGQCMPRSNYTAAQLVNVNAFPTSVKSTATGPSDAAKALSSGIASLFSSFTKPAPQPTMYATAPSEGVSPVVLVAGGVGVLALLYFVTRR